jgi:hypothetical protein
MVSVKPDSLGIFLTAACNVAVSYATQTSTIYPHPLHQHNLIRNNVVSELHLRWWEHRVWNMSVVLLKYNPEF